MRWPDSNSFSKVWGDYSLTIGKKCHLLVIIEIRRLLSSIEKCPKTRIFRLKVNNFGRSITKSYNHLQRFLSTKFKRTYRSKAHILINVKSLLKKIWTPKRHNFINLQCSCRRYSNILIIIAEPATTSHQQLKWKTHRPERISFP